MNQYAISQHHRDQFGEVSLHQIVSKLAEEVGEVSAAVTRLTEERHGEDWRQLALEEIGDVMIVLTALCGYLDGHIDEVGARAQRSFCERTWDIKKGRT